MKRIAWILILIVIVSCTRSNKSEEQFAHKTELEWFTNLDEAIKIAKEESKPIFVNFTGSDWCGWCFKLRDEVFVQPKFIEFAKSNLILVEIDFPRKKKLDPDVLEYNQKIAQKYNIPGFPTVLLLSSDGSTLLRTGYEAGGPDNYIKNLQKVM